MELGFRDDTVGGDRWVGLYLRGWGGGVGDEVGWVVEGGVFEKKGK